MSDKTLNGERPMTRAERALLEKQHRFTKAYAACASIKAAARAAGIRHGVHYEWMRTNALYRQSFEAVQEEAAQALEDEAVRRAHEGVRRLVLHAGRPVRHNHRPLYETEYSDSLLILLLKRFRPNLYRERTIVEHSGAIEIVERMQAARRRLLEMRAKDQAGQTG
jgi:hypothetical protein